MLLPMNSVKQTILLYGTLLFILCSEGFMCGRSAPESPVAVIPPVSTSLSLITSYELGAFASEPSAIVYSAKNNSFMIVSDSHPMIYETDLRGNLLHTVSVTSTDLEGISVSATNDTIYITEEKNRLVVSYNLQGKKLSAFSADVASVPNNALEGVTVGRNGHLFVLNEKLPGMLLEYTPSGTEIRRIALSFATDYSDLFYDAGEDCLWFISDESMKVVKTDMNAAPLAQWSVPFTKGEGISIVRDTVYIVNDADAKLYVFRKPT
jgi:uncharacterized protein YjiK